MHTEKRKSAGHNTYLVHL